MYNNNYKSIFELCQNLNLERLEVTDGYGNDSLDVLLIKDVPESLFCGAAKTVVVDPPGCIRALAEYWAKNEDNDVQKDPE